MPHERKPEPWVEASFSGRKGPGASDKRASGIEDSKSQVKIIGKCDGNGFSMVTFGVCKTAQAFPRCKRIARSMSVKIAPQAALNG